MKKYLFEQHIPNYCEGFKHINFYFTNFTELIKKYENRFGKLDNGWYYCYSFDKYNGYCLMKRNYHNWWVLGYIRNKKFPLYKFLPHWNQSKLIKDRF